MRIALTGGGTGGHFYPLIAIAEELRHLADEEKIIELKLYYLSDKPYDKTALFENGITFVSVPAGKRRLYRSVKNFFDIFKTAYGIVQATIRLFFIYPDLVLSKGGYASFPTLVAARILHIPVFIHESDTHPGRVNLWAGRFAVRIGLGYEEAAPFFKKEKIAIVGQPIRRDLLKIAKDGAHEYLKLDPTLPTIVVVGGSSGAQNINDAILESLPLLLDKYQIIHQVGTKNEDDIRSRSHIVVTDPTLLSRYKIFGFFNPLAIKMCAGAADLYISRAGSSSIAEIANFGVPAILIPIPESNSNGDHQRKNAYHYAHAGAAIVIEEKNLTPAILATEIDRILSNETLRSSMIEAAKKSSHPDAARVMAQEAIDIALSHEK